MGSSFAHMIGLNPLFCLAALAIILPEKALAQTACRLCGPDTAPKAMPTSEVPLRIEVETALDFSRVALASSDGGDVAVDARSGNRKVAGGLIDLGGMALRGTVRLKGEPGRPVRIDLPTRIEMRSTTGATAQIYDLQTNLSPDPVLGPDGTLSFSFGGRLSVKGAVSGTFRGSIPITADYQ
jgi:Domain of unknown function (DUF4402)